MNILFQPQMLPEQSTVGLPFALAAVPILASGDCIATFMSMCLCLSVCLYVYILFIHSFSCPFTLFHREIMVYLNSLSLLRVLY